MKKYKVYWEETRSREVWAEDGEPDADALENVLVTCDN